MRLCLWRRKRTGCGTSHTCTLRNNKALPLAHGCHAHPDKLEILIISVVRRSACSARSCASIAQGCVSTWIFASGAAHHSSRHISSRYASATAQAVQARADSDCGGWSCIECTYMPRLRSINISCRLQAPVPCGCQCKASAARSRKPAQPCSCNSSSGRGPSG
jgi:hypothetical protein